MRNREYWRERAKASVFELSDENRDVLRPLIKAKLKALVRPGRKPHISDVEDGKLPEFVFWIENEAHKLMTGKPLYTKPRFLVPAGSERTS